LTGTARPWLLELEATGIKLGLAQMRALLDGLAHPEQHFTAVTVAGTNGKGSVTAMVERGLRAAGCRTGRYTSPHLTHLEERVAIDGSQISADAFDRAVLQVRQAATALPHPPSFFEAATAAALIAFRDAGVELAVLEVGLGGRLDATNAVDAPVAAITNIGLDHQLWLGETIAAIAAEKAGVIKAGASVVAGRTSAEARDILAGAAAQVGASFTYAPDDVDLTATVEARGSTLTIRTPSDDYGTLRLALPGRHQLDNAVTAVRTLETASARGLARVDAAAIRLALADVRWPGRLDWRRWRGHDVLVDGAHNPDGARALAAFLRETMTSPVPFVFGMMRDKAIAEVIETLAPVASVLVCTAPVSPRAATPADVVLLGAAVAPALRCVSADTPRDALILASGYGSPIVVAGSLFLAGDVLPLLA
jgi:dihydrofolate synthase/folylpolyglutamate synthase